MSILRITTLLVFSINIEISINKNIRDFQKGLTKTPSNLKSFNSILNNNGKYPGIFRRKSPDPSSSSSIEGHDWKEEWKQRWKYIKQIALNSNITDRGDTVNMVAARPWGTPCGDPNQHDLPWGSCMLPMECESEFRIYRGDLFCGRTEYVCCALQLNVYDMYHGILDVSFSGTSLQTDSDEIKANKKKRGKKRGKEKAKRKRQKLRRKRKNAIKKLIRKTVKEIGKILNTTYKYGSKARERKTKQLKKFVREMKRKYKKDRQSMIDIHNVELFKIDSKLKKGLEQVRDVNKELVFNKTFRKWVVNGTLSKEGEKYLRDHYPDLWEELAANQKRTRRNQLYYSDYLEYDIEYGLVYD